MVGDVGFAFGTGGRAGSKGSECFDACVYALDYCR